MSYPKREVTTNFVPAFPKAIAGMLNVGILHTNAVGNAAHAAYAPCTVRELVDKGYDYWALGHVHEHAVLHERPWVVYPGNAQGRHAREQGAKGCVVIAVDNDRIVSVTHRACDVMRFASLELILAREDDRGALLDRVRQALDGVRESSDGLLVAVRLTVRGGCAAHAEIARDTKRRALVAEIRGAALDGGHGLWLERVVFDTRPATPIERLRDASDLVGELLQHTDALRRNPSELARLGSELGSVRKKLAHELEEAGVDLSSHEALVGILAEAEAMLAQRLTEDGAA
jgi:DNA repair protein SbcD/Mre11